MPGQNLVKRAKGELKRTWGFEIITHRITHRMSAAEKQGRFHGSQPGGLSKMAAILVST
jgi:hypothetical protein